MTMILTCLTKDYVVQASERRISYVNEQIPPKDDSNKAIVYANHFVFAYTGTTELGPTSTIEWAAQRLSESKNLDDAVYHLRDRGTDLMKNWYQGSRSKDKMVAFVGAGFGEMQEHGRWSLKPVRIVISNFFIEKNGMWSPRKEFRVEHEEIQVGQRFNLLVSGRSLSKERWNMLNKLLKRSLQRKETQGPETIGRFLAREILKAAETDKYIGKNIMCTFVPRKFVNDGSSTFHLGGMFLENPVLSTEPQQLKPRVVSLQERFVFPPPFDRTRIVYIDNNENALPSYTPRYVFPGGVVPEISRSDMSITVPPFIQVPDASVGQ